MSNLNNTSQIKAEFANPNTIKCKDCKNRDKSIVKIGSNIKYVGITRCKCDKYDAKPLDILFNNADCEYYEKEK